jgi:hypothetical protein
VEWKGLRERKRKDEVRRKREIIDVYWENRLKIQNKVFCPQFLDSN